MAEFVEWPKTKRLYRMITVTEKIDGTNSGIHIEKLGDIAHITCQVAGEPIGDTVIVGHDVYRLTAQSRNRLIYPGKGTDNFGFAAWVRDNGTRLVELLGEGLHMGEWWGPGINRGYNTGRYAFSLFNTDRYGHIHSAVGDVLVDSVPLLYQGMFRDRMILAALADLAENGSKAAPGFMNPEGVIVFHSQTRSNFKVTLDHQDCSKWEAGQP